MSNTIFLEHFHNLDGKAFLYSFPEYGIINLATSTPKELEILKEKISNEPDGSVFVGTGVIRKNATKADAIRLIERAMAGNLNLYR